LHLAVIFYTMLINTLVYQQKEGQHAINHRH
jgi:hypothetical protein